MYFRVGAESLLDLRIRIMTADIKNPSDEMTKLAPRPKPHFWDLVKGVSRDDVSPLP